MPGGHPMTRAVLVLVALVLCGVVAWRIYDNTNAARMERHGNSGPVTVDVVAVTKQSVPVVLQLTGHAETEHSVAVRAQVSGVLQKVLFQEGDEVAAGQLLFVIDPEPYAIQVAQSEGQVKQDEARLEADLANAHRVTGLTRGGFVSDQDVENAKAKVKEDKAAIATDKAKLAEARMQLGYTRIAAPISGRTGAIAFKAGNLVQAAEQTPLVTINQIAPILVRFDVPQSRLSEVQQYDRAGSIVVSAVESDGAPIENDGKLVFIDNGVNQASGTVTLKARFPNEAHQIWPGQLMAVNLTLTTEQGVTVVPGIAVQPGQKGSYVYTVQDGRIHVRNVTVQREYRGMAIIEGGVETGDLVVVRVPRNIKEGLAVAPNVIDMQKAVVTADDAP